MKQHDKLINKNIRIHDRIAKRYEKDHGEIFNTIEQDRLYNSLAAAIGQITTGDVPLRALDYGCGSGNLTRHLINFKLHVTAADISAEFLRLVTYRYGSEQLDTIKLNGVDVGNIPDKSFDLIAMYSVLHHIPDYLQTLKELAGKCKTGGVIYIDHEKNDEFWSGSSKHRIFLKEASKINWRKFLYLPNYLHKIKRLKNPRYTNEGDIHVWPDDHIVWKEIETLFQSLNFQVVLISDYLQYSRFYKPEVFDRYKNEITDTRVMAFKKL